jgi:hypothetical protein
MASIKVDSAVNSAGTGAVDFPQGLTILGVPVSPGVVVPPGGASGFSVSVIDIADSPYTLVNLEEVYIDSSGGPIAVILPLGVAELRIRLIDYGSTWFSSNNITIVAATGEKINGVVADAGSGNEFNGDVDLGWVELVYLDGTVGWRTRTP